MRRTALAHTTAALVLACSFAAASPKPTPTPVPTPSEPVPMTPTDEFGPDLKAWLEAVKIHDTDSANAALKRLQKRRAERNLSTIDDVAAAMAGRAETQASEGQTADALGSLQAATSFAPDSSRLAVLKATVSKNYDAAMQALELARANPFESGRLEAGRLLALLSIFGLFSIGFGVSLLIRYSAVFSHDVAEGLSGGLKSLSLFMAVLFIALPLAGFMGWGYLPFWWMTLFFIFESRAEKAVSILLLLALAVSSVALPLIGQQKAFDSAAGLKRLYEVARGGISTEGEALVKTNAAGADQDADWALLAAAASRRSGRMEEATAALTARAERDVRFAHNAAAIEFDKTNYAGAGPGFTKAAESVTGSVDQATALYNLALYQANMLSFEASKETRRKADALSAETTKRFDSLFGFDREGSQLQAAPDIVPNPARLIGPSLPTITWNADTAVSRLTVVALALLIFIPLIVKFRGSQSFSKQCPKCGTTFCWLCQTRSTSQDVCSQCHHMFVVKKGIPPAARAAKNQEISRHLTTRSLIHRLSSLLAPGAGHLAVGHFMFGLPLLAVWATAVGGLIALRFLAPELVASSPVGDTFKNALMGLAVITYLGAQLIKPKAPVVAAAPRRQRPGQEA